jgi:hypothetical protein
VRSRRVAAREAKLATSNFRCAVSRSFRRWRPSKAQAADGPLHLLTIHRRDDERASKQDSPPSVSTRAPRDCNACNCRPDAVPAEAHLRESPAPTHGATTRVRVGLLKETRQAPKVHVGDGPGCARNRSAAVRTRGCSLALPSLWRELSQCLDSRPRLDQIKADSAARCG